MATAWTSASAASPPARTSTTPSATAASAARYAFTDRLAGRLGVGAFTKLEDDPIVLPVIGVEWKPSDRWDVNVGIPETGMKYHATDEVDFFLRGAFEFNDYRLSGDGVLDGTVFRDDGIGFAVGATWRPRVAVELDVGVGATFNRSVTVDDRQGDVLFDEDLGAGAFGSVAVKVRL